MLILIVLTAIGFLPAILFLTYHGGRILKRKLRRLRLSRKLSFAVVSIAVFCFVLGGLLIVFSFNDIVPYYRQQQGLITGLLFLLVGLQALQVRNFIRKYSRSDRRSNSHSSRHKPAIDIRRYRRHGLTPPKEFYSLEKDRSG